MLGMLEKTESREWVTFENDGQQIFGVLHRPISTQNPPVVVFMHGFASSKHGSNRCYVRMAEELAKSGIAALRFDFRGSGDSEGSLSEITFLDLVSDAVKALHFTSSIEGIDSDRLGVFGASLGGALAVLATAQVERVKALALWAPVASGELWYRDFLQNHPQYIKADPNEILGSYRGVKLHPKFKEQFAQMFAYQAAAKLGPIPLLHMHGAKDTTISLAHQGAFQKACEAGNPKAYFKTFPDGEHSLGYSSDFPQIIQETLSWFKTNL